MVIDLSRARIPPYDHQVVGVQKICDHVFFGLFDEMGAGKTKQAIDGAQVLFTNGVINTVIVVAPASVRNVWFDKDLGELAKHLWKDLPAVVIEFHARRRFWTSGDASEKWPPGRALRWIITNYDFIRSKERLAALKAAAGTHTLLILDESSAAKNWKAKQTAACLQLRQTCGRVLLLNGTPIANSPMDMFSQGLIMHPSILQCQSFYHFRSRYAKMGGNGRLAGKLIIGYVNLEDLQQRFAPYVIRREKKDCLDLPPKLPPVTLTATLTPETWHVYKEMRDEMAAWLDRTTVSTASQAMVKAIRLAQVTSGFLGGVEEANFEPGEPDETRPAWLPQGANSGPSLTSKGSETGGTGNPMVREIGREKLEVFFDWLDLKLASDPKLKLLIWCRFRPELFRVERELRAKFPKFHIGTIVGGQKREEREYAVNLLDPRTMPKDPAIVVGTPASGALGLNLVGAHDVVDFSFDYNLKTYVQSRDRVHRPGQTFPVSYFQIIAVGPNGQKTIDHTVVKALMTKDNVASWTTSAWLAALRDE